MNCLSTNDIWMPLTVSIVRISCFALFHCNLYNIPVSKISSWKLGWREIFTFFMKVFKVVQRD